MVVVFLDSRARIKREAAPRAGGRGGWPGGRPGGLRTSDVLAVLVKELCDVGTDRILLEQEAVVAFVALDTMILSVRYIVPQFLAQ